MILTFKSRLKTRKLLWRWLFSLSSDPFRSNIDSTLFYAAILASCELSQIQTRTFFGEVTVWNVKLVVLILGYKSRLRTRSSFGRWLFSISSIQFCPEIDCAIFFAVFLDRRELFQIISRTLFGEVRVWNVNLVELILTYKSRLKTRKLRWRWLFASAGGRFWQRVRLCNILRCILNYMWVISDKNEDAFW